MKNLIQAIRPKLPTTLTLLSMLFWINAAAAQELIVHPSVKVETIQLKELRAIYAMRRSQWQDGAQVHLAVYNNDHELHREFSKELLAVFPHQLQTRWDKLVYSGRAAPPARFTTEAAMIAYVASTPGAVGYIGSHSSVPDTVKRVLVQGR